MKLGILRDIFFTRRTEDEIEKRLISRIEIRVTPDEKELIRQFADFRGVSTSELIRRATMKYIDSVLRVHDQI